MNDSLRSPAAAALAQRLSYAQCWEDSDILIEALHVGPEDDVLSIASAGDNSFALALAGARSVTAIDLSFPQLAVTELKLAATALDYDATLRLLGLVSGPRVAALYQAVREELSPGVRDYWDRHQATLESGLLASGKFERYLGAFQRWVLPLAHRRRTVDAMCEAASLEEQRRFFHQRWDSWRWRALLRTFFSRPVMSRTGRTRAHFAQVQGPVSTELLRRTRHVLTEIPLCTNPYAQWILRGRYPDLERSHPYLTRAGHARLREARGRIRLVHAELEQHLPSVKPGTYSAFNYSNLFEYVSAEQHEALLRLTVQAARPGARIAYWNLLVPRHRPASMAGVLERREAEAAAWLARDRAFVYGGFNLEIVR